MQSVSYERRKVSKCAFRSARKVGRMRGEVISAVASESIKDVTAALCLSTGNMYARKKWPVGGKEIQNGKFSSVHAEYKTLSLL